jgi:hypothetical protein
MWVRRDRAFNAIVDPGIYDRAVAIAESRYAHHNDDELLEMLRGLLKKHGRLCGARSKRIEKCLAPASSACDLVVWLKPIGESDINLTEA